MRNIGDLSGGCRRLNVEKAVQGHEKGEPFKATMSTRWADVPHSWQGLRGATLPAFECKGLIHLLKPTAAQAHECKMLKSVSSFHDQVHQFYTNCSMALQISSLKMNSYWLLLILILSICVYCLLHKSQGHEIPIVGRSKGLFGSVTAGRRDFYSNGYHILQRGYRKVRL